MTAQTQDPLEARLRDLFDRQANAIPVSARAASDVPITGVSDVAEHTRSRWTRGGNDPTGPRERRDRRKAGALALIGAAAIVAVIVILVALTSGTTSRGPAHPGGSTTAQPRAITFSLRPVLSMSSPPCSGSTTAGSGDARGCYTLGDPIVDLADVQSARAIHFSGAQWAVSLQFTKAAAPRFINAMQANVGRSVAFVIDGQVVLAPLVNPGITTGSTTISGALDEQAVKQLAARLNKPHPPRPTPNTASAVVVSPAIGSTGIVAFNGLQWKVGAQRDGSNVCVGVTRTTGSPGNADSLLGPGGPGRCHPCV
jgi:hypothetical protein